MLNAIRKLFGLKDVASTNPAVRSLIDAVPQQAVGTRPSNNNPQLSFTPPVERYKQILDLSGHVGPIHDLAFAPEGNLIATASADRTTRLFSFPEGKLIHTFTGHTREVFAASMDESGKLLSTGSGDKSFTVWNLQTKNKISTGEHIGPVKRLIFSKDSKTLYTAGGWNQQTRAPVAKSIQVSTGKTQQYFAGHEVQVASIALSADGSLLATGGEEGSIIVWDLAAGKILRELEGHRIDGERNQTFRGIYALAFSPNGKLLASGSDDETLRIWDVLRGTQIQKLTAHTMSVRGLSFSPDGALLASADYSEGAVRIWDTSSWKTLEIIEIPSNTVFPKAFSFHPLHPILFVALTPEGAKNTDGPEFESAEGHFVRAWAFNTSALAEITPNPMSSLIESKMESIGIDNHPKLAEPPLVYTSATDELQRLLRKDSSHPTYAPERNGRLPAASHSSQAGLTAAQAMAETRRLISEHATWSVIFSTLNPTSDTTISDLLIAIRGPHMFTPEVGLRVIQAGCENVLGLNAEATAVEALAAARRSLEKIRGADRY